MALARGLVTTMVSVTNAAVKCDGTSDVQQQYCCTVMAACSSGWPATGHVLHVFNFKWGPLTLLHLDPAVYCLSAGVMLWCDVLLSCCGADGAVAAVLPRYCQVSLLPQRHAVHGYRCILGSSGAGAVSCVLCCLPVPVLEAGPQPQLTRTHTQHWPGGSMGENVGLWIVSLQQMVAKLAVLLCTMGCHC